MAKKRLSIRNLYNKINKEVKHKIKISRYLLQKRRYDIIMARRFRKLHKK